MCGHMLQGRMNVVLGSQIGDVVGHRALGDHRDLFGLLDLEPVGHPGRRADVVGLGEHIWWALWVCDDLDSRCVAREGQQLSPGEAFVHITRAFPDDDLVVRLSGDPGTQVLVRGEDDRVGLERFDDCDGVGRGAA